MAERRTLSSRGGFLAAAAVLALWTSGAPSMVYPVYVEEWGVSPLVTTSVFAVYPIALVAMLVMFGSISDGLGRRAVILAGLGIVIVGTLLFAVAPGLPLLYLGRILQGVGVGLAMSPASAALVEFGAADGAGVDAGASGRGRARANVTNTAATAIGMAAATLVGGALVEHAPWPMRLPFWVLITAATGALVAVRFLPGSPSIRPDAPWRPRPVVVPRGIRLVFAVGTLAMAAGFAMGGVVVSLGAQIARDLVGTGDALVAAVVISVWALVIVPVSVLARRLAPHATIAGGGAAALVGLLLLVAASSLSSLPVFLASALIGGAGYGLLFLGGITLVNQSAPETQRAGTLSAMYLIAYVTQGLTAVAVGLSATLADLDAAIALWAPAIGIACLLAGVLALWWSRARR